MASSSQDGPLTAEDVDFPEDLVDIATDFQQELKNLSEVISPLSTLNINSTDYQMDPLDRAQLHLVHGLALNSLFWMYLKTIGINPREHKIKGEIERYKSFAMQIRELREKKNAPTLDKDAAKRFIRSALWTPQESEAKNAPSTSKEEEECASEPSTMQHEEEHKASNSKTQDESEREDEEEFERSTLKEEYKNVRESAKVRSVKESSPSNKKFRGRKKRRH